MGVVETTMAGLHAALGAPTANVLTVGMVYRLFSFRIPALSGVALVPYLQHRAPKPAVASRSALRREWSTGHLSRP